ncbi:hypothetical protein CBR_g19396 [Chara braunii]|uniref:Integrase catalytic domain-containing protein n=1 Tax=Chara braunii TaxID=69332 RepID=A0A388KY60_CHABU|nr:hypothetical protein CBR_g19396 [Chara braunii]|eukprot:GBG74883.1 hypothetical protein CBR_g19396 [Chara braunii]
MLHKYRLGDGLLTISDLEGMNKDDLTTIGAFVQEFKKKARKVHGISEERQCTIFLGLLTGSEAAELTSHGGGSAKLTWATIDRGVKDGSLDQVEQHQMGLQRRKRKERDATASGTPGVKRIVTDVLAALGYGQDAEAQRKAVAEVQGRGREVGDEGAGQEDYGGEETGSQILTKAQRKQHNLLLDGQGSGKGQAPQAIAAPPKRKYTVRLEEDFDVERMVDRLLEGHNDLMNLKDILASAPRLREELKGRLSRRLVPNVHLSAVLPREVGWTQAGTRMDWKCAACGLVDLVIKEKKCVAMMDTGAEMNIIRERDALMLGMKIDRADHGVLHEANCKAVFCGTASNVIIEIGKVRARTCFFVMPDVDHPILLGRSFMCRTETLIFNKHDGTMILLLSDPACGNYKDVTCRNMGPGSEQNRPNPGSFTYVESKNERRRLAGESEEEGGAEVLSLSLTDLIKKRHRAYAFNDDQRGRLDVDKIPMIRIHTVPHEPWNLRGARYPNPDEEKMVVDYLDGKMRMHVAGYSSGSYASPWFCFIKPNGTLRFVKDFAAKTGHLRELVCQDQEWVWGEDQEEAVARMKREFKEGGLVLGAPNYEGTEEKPFIIETDAGPTSLGGVLIQADVEGKERPLRFESRTLNTTERNYSLFKKETLAVLHCLRVFRNYVFGMRFILRVDPTALACFLKNYTPSDPTVARWLTYIWMFNFELERIPGNKNRADGLSRVNWDSADQGSIEDTPPVDGFLDQEEDVRLHINKWALRVPSCVSYPIWIAPREYERKADLILKPFQEEDPWGGKDTQWMMKLALAGTHGLVEEVRTIEEGPTQIEEHEQLMGGMYLLTNTLLQGDFDRRGSFSHEEDEVLIPESQDDEFEEGEIKEAFRAEEYDGIYLELGLLLSCEMRDRDASDKAQKLRHLYVVRDGHLFIKRQVGNPKRIVCRRNRQLDIIAALYDGIAGGHRGVSATCAKISELYHWDGMLTMVIKYCQSCVPCQERSAQRPGEPLHPRLEREVGAVEHLDLLFMPMGENGCNYIFDARDNLTGFVDGRAIRTKTGPVLASCIEEYYLRCPFVKEFMMDRGSEFTCNEVRTLPAGYGVVTNYTTAAHPQANAPVERGHSTITNLLAKWTEGKPGQWPKFLRATFFVENITVKRTTKYAPATLWYGRHATFPIESFMKTWRREDLEVNLSFEELLDIRARQFRAAEERLREAAGQVERSRMEDKMRWDQTARVRKEPLAVGDSVLLYDSSLEKQWSRKLDKGWLGPYRIVRCGEFGAYQIEELNGTKWKDWRGGRGTRPRQRPLGASGGEERHGPFRREPTPVFDDDNIELFLDAYREHAARRGWDVAERIRHLRGVGRFEEPIAQIREEALTWSEVEARMQRLRASTLGNDGLPIRLEEGNAEEFIPAYERYMSDQGVSRDEWVQALRLWTREAERPLLRVAFRRPELERPEPRVDRRRRSKRLRDLEAREPVTSRGGRKALAQREGGQVGPASASESFPACGLRQVEFHQVTEDDLLGPSPQAPEQRESEVPTTPFRSLEAHLDASQWEAPSTGENPTDPSGGEQTRLEPEAEPLILKGVGAEDVIVVEGDTPPDSPARAQTQRSWPEGVAGPDSQEAPVPPPEATMSPWQEVEARGPVEGWRTEPRLIVDSRLAAHAAERPDIEETSPVGPSSGLVGTKLGEGSQAATGEVAEAGTGKEPDKAAQAKRARVRARLEEIHERRDKMEAAGIAPRPPVSPKTSEERIDEEAIKWVDKGIKQTSMEAFHRYSLLSDELALRKDEVEQLTAQLAEERAESKARQTRLEAKEAEWEAKLKEMAAAVEKLTATKVIDWTEQSRYGIQGKGVQGLFGQEEAAEASRQEKLGKVFLDPAEAEARKEANKGSFEFKAPT